MQLSFRSIHALGSDYIVIDESDRPTRFSQESRPKLASALSDRRAAAGADGVVFVDASQSGGDASLQIFTPSGHESELCINGVLCAARYLTDKLDKERIVVATPTGTVEITRSGDIALPMFTSGFVDVQRGLAPPYVEASIPVLWDTTLDQFTPSGPYYAVGIGVPHLICVVPKIRLKQLEHTGTLANARQDIFPTGMNVTFVARLSSGVCYARTFERGGAGLTSSCATAMLATSYVLCHLPQSAHELRQRVFCPGGAADCELGGAATHSVAKLTVPCLYAYTAEIGYQPDTFELSGWLDGRCNDEEALAYQRFKEEVGLDEVESRVVDED